MQQQLQSICILGRQPALGRAELESLLGAEHFQVAGDTALASDLPVGDIPFARLGGTVKLGTVVADIPAIDWRTIQAELSRQAVALAQVVDEGSKIQLGVSVYGMTLPTRSLFATGLELKKALRNHGYSARLTPNQEAALSSAQVLHNHLTSERGIELLVVHHGARTIIARTVAIQDIDAYAARDQQRPKRDAFVGMLPPKLAQIIVNLATAQRSPSADFTVLDPFCGTGVILQEALLTGYNVFGSDNNPKMVAYTQTNVCEWFHEELHPEISAEVGLTIADATNHQWKAWQWDAKQKTETRERLPIGAVASETYLGRPLSNWPKPEQLHEIIGTCNVIIEKFLKNLAGQTKPGTRACLAVPAWKNPSGQVHHLPLLDHLAQLGYNRVSFEHARDSELLYFRPDQLVARELLVITRK